MTIPFTRPLTVGAFGSDVEGVSRALCRAGYFWTLSDFMEMSLTWRRTYGWRRAEAVNKLRKAEGWVENGTYNEACHHVLVDGGYFDARAAQLMRNYKPPLPPKPERIRTELTDFLKRAEANEDKWHYTQARPFSGLGVEPERTHYNDCSSYVVLAYYWARKQTGLLVPDPSGYNYSGWGNTWDDLDGHPRVSGPYSVGDLAHYEGHVTICRRGGSASDSVWSSFGREAGPENTSLRYRSDFRFVVRPPLGV